jgi:hypothetical protein
MASVVFAETVKMSWKQPTEDLVNLKEWVLYMADSPTVTPTKIEVVPYTGQTSLTVSKQVTVTGTPGETVKRYFSIAAVSKNGNMTDRVQGKTVTGLDYLEFVIPFSNVGLPFDVIIEVIVQ